MEIAQFSMDAYISALYLFIIKTNAMFRFSVKNKNKIKLKIHQCGGCRLFHTTFKIIHYYDFKQFSKL